MKSNLYKLFTVLFALVILLNVGVTIPMPNDNAPKVEITSQEDENGQDCGIAPLCEDDYVQQLGD